MKTAQRSYQADKEQDAAMKHKRHENVVEPHQLPEGPKQLKLDEAEPKPEASTKKLAPSLITTEGR